MTEDCVLRLFTYLSEEETGNVRADAEVDDEAYEETLFVG